MREFVRNSALAVLALFASTEAFAQAQGVYLPAPPQGSGGEDSIETAGGTRCRQSINSSGGYVDVGVSGSAATPETVDPFLQYRPFSNERDARALVYARVTIPLGQRPERIDCTRLYEMELQRLREEIALLQPAAGVGRKRRSEGNQAFAVPVDDRVE